MKTLTKTAAVLSLVAFGALPIRAASVLYGPVVANDAPTELNTTILLPQWNPADHPGSVLTGATFTLTAHANGSITLSNTGLEAHSGSGTTTVQMILKDPNNQTVAIATPAFTTGNILLGAQSSQMISGLIGSAMATGQGSPLSLYMGTGSVAMNLSTVTGLDGGGNFGGAQITQAGAAASVVYTFAPEGAVGTPASSVPLPSAANMGLAGLSALAMIRTVRSKRDRT